MSKSQKPELALVGVCHLSDLYPNTRYKLQLLQERHDPVVCLYDLGGGNFSGRLGGRGLAGKLALALQLLWGHLWVLGKALLHPAQCIYVTYPGLLIVLCYSLLPRRWRPRILLDAFISLYDTIVHDRGLLPPESLRARMLFWLERRAFSTADAVLVDTAENGNYYSALFGLPAARFVPLPLAIPDLPLMVQDTAGRQQKFTCLFMGSMVPLQGIQTILECAALLAEESEIQFRVIGDGQQGPLISSYLAAQQVDNLVWHQGLLGTAGLVNEINQADLCLGIFGRTAKAERVLPYKLYYYAALGKPFVTRESPCLHRLAAAELLCGNDAKALAERILHLYRNPENLAQCKAASTHLHKQHLSRERLQEGLESLLQYMNPDTRQEHGN